MKQLQQEVESLLSNESQATGFLSEPVFAAAAGIINHAGGTMLTGRRIGVYQIQTLLGAGGMGEVYRARDTKLGRDVAIKILPSARDVHSAHRSAWPRTVRQSFT